MLLKYYLGGRRLPVSPYIGGGYVLRSLSGVKAGASFLGGSGAGTGTNIPLNTSFLLRDNPTHGIAASAGLRLRAGPLRLSPEVRFTRWTGRAFDEQGSRGFSVQSLQNQVDLLVGLSFR
jgi:hypothetical protein